MAIKQNIEDNVLIKKSNCQNYMQLFRLRQRQHLG